ncbi:hypothetical protein ABES23_07760 [Peribacillus frigoritolerans]|jgi:hypothetical protein|uniref:hypothetical protein n=1 Tax=Peribacillus frigoritolerans TaxID=450367 RepID=UPI000BBA2188|nr:hypothetical protein [Peribacillus frigoritolerans]MCP1493092.1 hypothetical protein [Peribacillus frigoritolerans]PCD05845.1 hypothetical protein CMV16_20975 [Peribacillus simplex]
MINGELLDGLIKLVEDAGGVLFIQTGTLAERPQSQPVGNLFIDTTTRIMHRFNGQIWECLLSSSDVIAPSVSEEVTESFETAKATDPSPIIREKSPF